MRDDTMSKIQLSFDPATAGAEIDRTYELWQAAEKLATQKVETAAKLKEDLTRLLMQAKASVPDFKAFVEKHTHVSYSTAKRMLCLADGRGEEVRQQERERQQRHRAAKAVTTPVTALPTVRLSNGEALKSEGLSEAARRQIAAAIAGNDEDPRASAERMKEVHAAAERPTTEPPTSEPTPKRAISGRTSQPSKDSPEWLFNEAIYFEKHTMAKMDDATFARVMTMFNAKRAERQPFRAVA